MNMSHYKGPDTSHLHFTSILKLLYKALENNGHETALVDGHTGQTSSYSDILHQSGSIAAGLHSKGVTAGDVVVVCCEKSFLAFSALLGVMFTGATTALVPTANGDIIPELTKGHYVKALFYDAANTELVTRSLEALTPIPTLVATTDTEDPVLSTLLNNADEISVFQVEDTQMHIPIILYSSGTTGVPKGIQITDVSLQMATVDSSQGLTLLNSSPMYWASGLLLSFNCLLKKNLLVLSNSTEARVTLQMIEKYKIEVWYVAIGVIQPLLEEQIHRSYDLSSLKRVIIGGDTFLERQFEDFVEKVLKNKLRVETMYASTESGVLTYNTNHKLVDLNKVVSSGKVLPGAEIKIVGEDGEIVPLGRLGELWVRSVNLTTGYWNEPELNDQLFEDGFLRTGDVGYFDEEGNLFVLGREADAITFQGTKMFPTEVESALLTHKAVLEAGVVGKLQQDKPYLTTFVVLKPGYDVSEDDLRAFVNDRIEDQNMRLRGGIHFLDCLPRTVVTKLKRKQLRELACTFTASGE